MTWLSDCLPEASCEEDQGLPDKGMILFQNMSVTKFLLDAHSTGNGYSPIAPPAHSVVSTRSQSKEPGQAREVITVEMNSY